eukprot:tig00022075_g23586.t1
MPVPAVKPVQPAPAALEEVIPILDDAQQSKSTHAHCLKRLSAVKKSAGGAFIPYFIDKLNRVLVIGKKEAAVDRLVEFFCNFTVYKHKTAQNKSASMDGDFVDDILRHLLSLAMAKNNAVRFRVCEIAGGIIKRVLDEGVYFREELLTLLKDEMMPRLQDVNASVRAAALRALSPFLRSDQADEFKGLAEEAARMLEQDPNKEVRKVAIAALDISAPQNVKTLRNVITRAKIDKDESVRAAAFVRLAEEMIDECIPSKEIVDLIKCGTTDGSSLVQKYCNQTIVAWHKLTSESRGAGSWESDKLPVLSLVWSVLKAESATLEDAEAAALAIAEAVVAGARAKIDVPAEARLHLTPAGAVVWRVLCERALEREEKGEAGEEEAALVPVLSELAALLRQHGPPAVEGKRDDLIVCRQLLALAARQDFADEAGRSRIYSALSDLVREPSAPFPLLEPVLETLLKAAPTRDAFVTSMCEVCSELYASERQGEVDPRASACKVAAFVLKHATAATPALVDLVEEKNGEQGFVVLAFRDGTLSAEARAEAVRALGLYLTLNPKEPEAAVRWMASVATPLLRERAENPPAFLAALECAYDVALVYGFPALAACVVPEGFDPEVDEAGGLEPWLRGFLVDMLEAASTEEEARVAAEGVAKLLHRGRIPADDVPGVLARVILRLLAAGVASDARVRDCLQTCLRAYAFPPDARVADRRVRAIEASVPDVMWAIALAPAGSPLASVKPEAAAETLLYLTDQQPLPAVLQDPAADGSTAHERIARAALLDALADEEGQKGKGPLAKLAIKLAAGARLRGKDAPLLAEIKYLASWLEEEAAERTAKQAFKKIAEAARAAGAPADDGNRGAATALTRRVDEAVEERQRALTKQANHAKNLASRLGDPAGVVSDGAGARPRPKRAVAAGKGKGKGKGRGKGAAAPAAAAAAAAATPARGTRKKVVASSSSSESEEEQSESSEEEERPARRTPAARTPAARASKSAAAERMRSSVQAPAMEESEESEEGEEAEQPKGARGPTRGEEDEEEEVSEEEEDDE